MNTITFEPVIESGLDEFIKRLQTAFSLAIATTDTKTTEVPIPSVQDIESNYYNTEAETYNVYRSGQRVGGIIVSINCISNHNHLDFFFIDPEHHSKGIGYEVWKAIEMKYPKTKIWQTGTPYFEKRNIHFYVNKCGFQINAYFCEYHPDPHFPQESDSDDNSDFDDGFFNFIKIMKTES